MIEVRSDPLVPRRGEEGEVLSGFDGDGGVELGP